MYNIFFVLKHISCAVRSGVAGISMELELNTLVKSSELEDSF